ncbi:uncharacterized protein MYCFIDRAFT_212690 [Pseudocercospora fijiensis CIRAD86]|uniref:FAD-binding domain-containing protein n=1 Tax=Pseudocercospora fijiensis (strain CIRAD86) TaxID=383855 RepID=M3AJL1_PSEFD|nr:uncharacterized protein MYCFIDRAFT_212690 [Pseudocercospora fijiensis CIRAD86]EME77353.1 hypothetical protein MYCFIDRAFT_212690 [Pseudocercospora fijiensis CIRAD86]
MHNIRSLSTRIIRKNWMFWGSTVDVPQPEDPERWLIQLMFFWKPGNENLSDQASRTAFLRFKAEEYVEPWRSILNAIPDDACFGIDHIHEWEPFDWSSSPLADRVTLAGGAAHNMAPHRGQGLNVGLQDAAVLGELLSTAKPTPEKSACSFESVRGRNGSAKEPRSANLC